MSADSAVAKESSEKNKKKKADAEAAKGSSSPAKPDPTGQKYQETSAAQSTSTNKAAQNGCCIVC